MIEADIQMNWICVYVCVFELARLMYGCIDTAHSATGPSFRLCGDDDDNDGNDDDDNDDGPRMIFYVLYAPAAILCSILYARSATTQYSEGILFQMQKYWA